MIKALFTSATGMTAQTVFLDNGNMIKKLNFPRICLPAITVLNALVNFAITFSIFLIFLVLTHNFPGWVALCALPILLVQIALLQREEALFGRN